jgi:hypothetical protein
MRFRMYQPHGRSSFGVFGNERGICHNFGGFHRDLGPDDQNDTCWGVSPAPDS